MSYDGHDQLRAAQRLRRAVGPRRPRRRAAATNARSPSSRWRPGSHPPMAAPPRDRTAARARHSCAPSAWRPRLAGRDRHRRRGGGRRHPAAASRAGRTPGGWTKAAGPGKRVADRCPAHARTRGARPAQAEPRRAPDRARGKGNVVIFYGGGGAGTRCGALQRDLHGRRLRRRDRGRRPGRDPRSTTVALRGLRGARGRADRRHLWSRAAPRVHRGVAGPRRAEARRRLYPTAGADGHPDERAQAALVVGDLDLPDPGRAAAVAAAGGRVDRALQDRAQEARLVREALRGAAVLLTAVQVANEVRLSAIEA